MNYLLLRILISISAPTFHSCSHLYHYFYRHLREGDEGSWHRKLGKVPQQVLDEYSEQLTAWDNDRYQLHLLFRDV